MIMNSNTDTETRQSDVQINEKKVLRFSHKKLIILVLISFLLSATYYLAQNSTEPDYIDLIQKDQVNIVEEPAEVDPQLQGLDQKYSESEFDVAVQLQELDSVQKENSVTLEDKQAQIQQLDTLHTDR